MVLSCKHSHRMVVDEAPTLNALVQPMSTMSVLVYGNGKRLSTTIVDSIDESHVEFVRVFCEVVRARHAYDIGELNLGLQDYKYPPAAPAPTTSTRFFLVACLPFVEVILTVGRRGSK